MSKLFSGDFNGLIFELTRLILAHFVHRGTVSRPRAATAAQPTVVVCQARSTGSYRHLV